MSSDCCCSSKSAHPKKRPCPGHGGECAEVSPRTVAQHVKQPWKLDGAERRYYFCGAPDCDVVYFGDDDLVIDQAGVRIKVGLKDASDGATLCYCFGVTKADALKDSAIKEYVMAQTKQGQCACETRNPSGLCCLKNFPR